jgi:hypothetical protein
MSRIRSHLTYSNVISTLCLFVLLGGGAYAAIKVPRASVGTKQLKANAVKGPKVAPGSLSASDIGGPVTSALSADQADDADRLGGLTSAGYFPSAKVERFRLNVSSSGSQFDLITIGPLDMDVSCSNLFDTQTIGIHATGSAAGAELVVGLSAREVGTTEADAGFTFLSGTESNLLTRDAGMSSSEVGAGQFVYDDASETIVLTFRYLINETSDDCEISGLAMRS